MDLTKLGRTEQVLSGAGLLLFIFSFFPWFSASVDLEFGGSASGHANAWSDPSGFIDWFPVLLLLVYAVVLALPAIGVVLNGVLARPADRAFIGLVLCAFAVLLFAIQGLTYPSLPAGIEGSAGPSWAYFVCLVIVLAAGAQSYLGFIRQGGSFTQVGTAIQARTRAMQQQQNQQQAPYGQPPQGSYPPPTFGGQAPQDPQPPFGQQPPQPPQPPYPPSGS